MSNASRDLSANPPLRKACVIQANDGKARERADRVLHSIIEPACHATGYEPFRVDELDRTTIAQPIISALNTYPLAIADLAAPPCDPNTLLEVGFRLATGRPIVFLADADPKGSLLMLGQRKVSVHTIDPNNPAADVERLIFNINKYVSEINYWESDYPTIEFSISFRSMDGGRVIFANDRVARLYGVDRAEELIGMPVNDVDARLKDFVPDEAYYEAYSNDQNAILGKITKRDPGPKTASVPLWFTKPDAHPERDNIYWPVLVQQRYVSDETDADIVMRVIFINISEWDAVRPRPRTPPQVLRIPSLFREKLIPPGPPHKYDVFLSYNSRDIGYVGELYETMSSRCGMNIWFDQTGLSGVTGMSPELRKAIDLSRIFALVLGRNGLGPWQERFELRSALLKIIRGQMPFVLLLLPDVQGVDYDWRNVLGETELAEALRGVAEDRLVLPLPDLQELRDILAYGRPAPFAESLLRFVFRTIRGLK